MASTFSEEDLKAAFDKIGDAPKMKQIAKELIGKINAGETPIKAIGLTPEVQEALYNYAESLFKSGKYQTALSQFIFLSEMEPFHYNYKFAIAACYQHLEKYPEAAGNYILCSGIEPLNPIPSMHLYHCFKKMGNPMSALAAITQAIEAVDKNPEYEEMKERILMEYKGFKREVKKYMVDRWGNEEEKKRFKEEDE